MTKKTGAHRSGDPRRRSQEAAMRAGVESYMFWQPFRHRCGCYLQWGMPVPDPTVQAHRAAQQEMFRFFMTIARFPCPMHGSATGVPAEPLLLGRRRYMPASNAWYRDCPPEKRVYADRVSDEVIGVPDLRTE